MDFEWDNKKNNANIAKHGIDFEFAKEIFSDIKNTSHFCKACK
jgi:uncharacterized DUF497 family protein